MGDEGDDDEEAYEAPFFRLDLLAWTASIGLLAQVGMDVAALWMVPDELGLPGAPGGAAVPTDLTAYDWAGVVIFGVTGLSFIAWLYFAYKNLRALYDGPLGYSPWSAIAGVLIPFFILFRPYQMLSEVWWGSDPEGVDEEGEDRWSAGRSAHWLPRVWGGLWAGTLGCGLLSEVLVRASSASLHGWARPALLLSLGLEILAAPAAIALLLTITRMQAKRLAKLGGQP
jgi:hypothetical protein